MYSYLSSPCHLSPSEYQQPKALGCIWMGLFLEQPFHVLLCTRTILFCSTHSIATGTMFLTHEQPITYSHICSWWPAKIWEWEEHVHKHALGCSSVRNSVPIALEQQEQKVLFQVSPGATPETGHPNAALVNGSKTFYQIKPNQTIDAYLGRIYLFG
jgi:hypothetical protein